MNGDDRAGQSWARHCEASQGRAIQGKTEQGTAGQGSVRQTGQGNALQDIAGHGKQGMVVMKNKSGQGRARQFKARKGKARQGMTGQGRQGGSGQGSKFRSLQGIALLDRWAKQADKLR
jgi:hypothetical protein